MQLIVKQVYNNNSLLVKVGKVREAIVEGKGIGFGKRRGSKVDSNKITKIMYVGDKEDQQQFSSMLKNIPLDIVLVVFYSIDQAKDKYGLALLNYLYLTLSDHIFQMYRKKENGTYQLNQLPSLKDRYPVEYQAARDTWMNINQKLGVNFPPEEIKSIALHYINAKGEEENEEEKSGHNLISNINEIVENIFAAHGIVRNVSNQNYFDRFMVHLQYLVDRVENKNQDSQDLSNIISNNLKEKYSKTYAISQEITRELEDKLNIYLTENERLYFIIHIQRLIQE